MLLYYCPHLFLGNKKRGRIWLEYRCFKSNFPESQSWSCVRIGWPSVSVSWVRWGERGGERALWEDTNSPTSVSPSFTSHEDSRPFWNMHQGQSSGIKRGTKSCCFLKFCPLQFNSDSQFLPSEEFGCFFKRRVEKCFYFLHTLLYMRPKGHLDGAQKMSCHFACCHFWIVGLTVYLVKSKVNTKIRALTELCKHKIIRML